MKFRVIELFALGLFIGSASAEQPNPDPSSVEKTCPSGDQKSTDCNSQACANNELCYKISNTVSICCAKKTFCQLTGMFSYFAKTTEGGITKFTYQYSSAQAKWFYEHVVSHVSWKPACPRPFSYLLQNEYTDANKDDPNTWKKVMPVGFQSFTQTTPLETCEKNNKCKSDEFCGDVFNYSENDVYHGKDEQNKKFCYKIPALPPKYASTTEYVRLADSHSLVYCNVNTECDDRGAGPNAYCYVPGGTTKYSVSVEVPGSPVTYKKVEYNGLCVISTICKSVVRMNAKNEQVKFEFDKAGAPYQTGANNGCSEDEQCGDGGETAPSVNTNRTTYNNYCIKDTEKVPHGVCCYEKLPVCEYGSTESPLKHCSMRNQTVNEQFKAGGFAECNSGPDSLAAQTTTSMRWCDSKKEVCCKNNQAADAEGRLTQFCDDGQTPLFNEPACTNPRRGEVYSGTCTRTQDRIGAICKNGHCCPNIKKVDGKTVLGKNSYVTQHPCTPGIFPPQFLNGFCDPVRKVIVMFGTLSPQEENYEKYPRDSPKPCGKDSDCSTDNSTLCLRYDGPPFCYFNPMKPLQKPANALWLAVLITSVILAFVFLCTSICCMVLYRSKSVFDKYKPKKKGGKKGGKSGGGKGSKSKSSKKSKKSKETETDTKSVTESKKSVMQ